MDDDAKLVRQWLFWDALFVLCACVSAIAGYWSYFAVSALLSLLAPLWLLILYMGVLAKNSDPSK
jgi:hypothetical protein